MSHLPKLTKPRSRQEKLEQLTHFELKDNLIKLADARHARLQRSMIETAQGNPNWTALKVKEAYYALANFAIQECRRDRNKPSGFGGVPIKAGIATRFYKYLQDNKNQPGIDLLTELYKNGIRYFSPEVEEMIIEFVEGISGNHFSYPTRILHYCERVVRAFLVQELCAAKEPFGMHYDIFAVEGGPAAIHYTLNSLIQNKLLSPGDRVAIAVPIFTPYFEIPQLDKFKFDVVYIQASDTNEDGSPNYQYPESELDKLADKSIKAFLIMDPSNPCSVKIDDKRRKYLVDTIKKHNPEIIIVTDNTHATFAEGFSSLMNDLPYNTIAIYSFSKYFGCTGCCLGAIALHVNNVCDDKIRNLPQLLKNKLNKLYGLVTPDPDKMKFIDRIVADSRDVPLMRMAGLSTPQQVLMAIMAGFAVVDVKKENSAYKNDLISTLKKRYALFCEGMKLPVTDDPNRSYYYITLNIGWWASNTYGPEFFEWINKNVKPADILYRVVEESAIVLVNSDNFLVTDWSIRISLANLESHEYEKLGRTLFELFEEYAETWKNSK